MLPLTLDVVCTPEPVTKTAVVVTPTPALPPGTRDDASLKPFDVSVLLSDRPRSSPTLTTLHNSPPVSPKQATYISDGNMYISGMYTSSQLSDSIYMCHQQ
jgi:hypothetical protein